MQTTYRMIDRYSGEEYPSVITSISPSLFPTAVHMAIEGHRRVDQKERTIHAASPGDIGALREHGFIDGTA